MPRRLSRTTILIGLSALLSIAIIWIVLAVHVALERREVIAAAVNANENRVIAFEQYVIRTLENAETATLYLIGRYGELEAESTPRVIDDPVLRRAAFVSASVVDSNGRIVASSAPLARGGQYLARKGIFEFHARNPSERLHIGLPRRSTILDVPVVSLTRRITREDGSFGGIVGVQISPRQFTNFYNRTNVSPRDLMSVIGLDGITRARRTGNHSSYGEDLTGFQVMAVRAADPIGNFAGPGGLDDIFRYVSYRTLSDYPLFVTVGVAREDVLASLRTRHTYHYWGAILLSALILLLAWLLVSGIRRRQAAALAVTDANARLLEAQRIGCIGDWSYDIESGVVSWSDHLFVMYERDPHEGAPRFEEVLSYFDEAGRAVVTRAVKEAIKTGEPQRYEYTVRVPSGAVSYHQASAVADKDANGKVVRLRGTDQDVSSRKLLENLQAELAHISRFDAMNTMAGTLAHELNQPLTAASNYLAGLKRMLDRGDDQGEELVAEGVRSAEKQIRLAGDIIRRVRDMIADRAARYERVSLSDVINDASSLVAMANDHPGMSIDVKLGPDAKFVKADAVQLQQVLINLIRNACEATEEGTAPSIRIRSARHGDDEVRVCVRDNGMGVPDSVKDLFSTFSTSKAGGLGIGLSISRTIVEAHGGSIWIESTGTSGTTICFTLPADGETVTREMEAASS